MDIKTEQKSMDVKQKIAGLMRIKGPVIPVQISKLINSDILTASAYLSELSSEGKVKISNVKFGGSPLYYLPGQEALLEKFSDNLHEKEKKAFELLKQNKILRDNKLEPVIRVALREIKDFAIPLQVTYPNNREIFWRWYLLSKEESELLIKSLLTKKEIPEEIKKEERIEKEPIKKEIKKIIEEKPLKEEIEEKPKEAKKFIDKTDSFLDEIKSFFNKNKIIIKNLEIIRKNAEMDFILEVPSAVGNLEYYCKTKNKKRINDGDLSSAYVQSQLKKLPVLFLTKGELTKRAKEMLNTDFKNINIKKI